MDTTWPTKTASACHTASHGKPGLTHEQPSAGAGHERIAAQKASVVSSPRIIADIAIPPLDAGPVKVADLRPTFSAARWRVFLESEVRRKVRDYEARNDWHRPSGGTD
jgi:hypothetical protein